MLLLCSFAFFVCVFWFSLYFTMRLFYYFYYLSFFILPQEVNQPAGRLNPFGDGVGVGRGVCVCVCVATESFWYVMLYDLCHIYKKKKNC